MQSDSGSIQTSCTFNITSSLEWEVFVHGRRVAKCPLLRALPEAIQSKRTFEEVFNTISSSTICTGNPDEKFKPLQEQRKGKFLDSKGDKTQAYVDMHPLRICSDGEMKVVKVSIRHSDCELLIQSSASRCSRCAKCFVIISGHF